MAQLLISQPEFSQKSPIEIFNKIQRDGFQDFILHAPKIEVKPMQNEFGEIDDVVAFGYGTSNVVGIKNSLELTHWKAGVREKVVGPKEIQTGPKTAEQSLVTALNPLAILLRLGVEKRQSKSVYKINKFVINKEGNFGIVIAEDSCFVIMADISEIRMLDKEQVGKVTTVAIVEGAIVETGKVTYEFFLGNNKGSVKYGTVTVFDSGQKRSENSVVVKTQTFNDFRTADEQPSSINGIFAVETHGKDNVRRNNLFIAIDKSLYHLQNPTTFDNFVKNPSMYLKPAKVVLESLNVENTLYVTTLFNNDIITLYMLEVSGLRSVVINTTEETQIREEMPLFDATGKLAIQLDPELRAFHVTAYHYVFVFGYAVVVVNSITKELAFRQTFQQMIKTAFRNMRNGNLILCIENRLFELEIINELVGSWIHLVERGMEDVAYTTCENYDQAYLQRAGGLLARKYFSQRQYIEGTKKLFENNDAFESAVWKFYSFRSDSDSFFKSLIFYCQSLLERMRSSSDDKQRSLNSLRTRVLLLFMVECLSYKYVQTERLLDYKPKEGERLNTNVTVDDKLLSFYQQTLKLLLEKHSKLIDREAIKSIFVSHGNFKFANEFETLIGDFREIVFDFICFDNFEMAVLNMKAYLTDLMSEVGRGNRDFKERALPFQDLMERFGIDFLKRVGNDFMTIVDRLFTLDCVLAFDERMFTSGLLCLQSAWLNKDVWSRLFKIIEKALKFLKKEKDQSNQSKFSAIQTFVLEIAIVNLYASKDFKRLAEFIESFDVSSTELLRGVPERHCLVSHLQFKRQQRSDRQSQHLRRLSELL